MSGSPSDAEGICEIKACVRACVLVLPAHFVTAVGSAWRETLWVRAFTALWMKTAFCISDSVVFRATYRTEKWEHPFGLRHPLWS